MTDYAIPAASTIVRIVSDASAKQAAHAKAAELTQAGMPCYVRNWHLGELDWHVVCSQTYRSLWRHSQA